MSLQPPGRTGEIDAQRILVLAPHFDDEILGCGGLAVQLATRGRDLRVAFLTDGAGGMKEVADRRLYRRRRQAEAEAVRALLGFGEPEYLAFPDGALSQMRSKLKRALGDLILGFRPDLLLVPSPLEVSEDHRAAFAAAFDVLTEIRRGDALAEVADDLEILLYEVNHPLYPNFLVDVSDQVDALESAMALYASQQERHDYLAAAVGLRRFRTLSLTPEVTAAEGYVRLAAADFRHHSHSQLLRRLGAVPELVEVPDGPAISVIVRTKDRPELLAEALASLAKSTYLRTQVVVVNDGGERPEFPEDFPLKLTLVDLAENRGRAGAANAGVAAATGEYLCFLDDDDRVAPEHLETLVGLAEGAGVRVAYTDAAVGIYELGGRNTETDAAREDSQSEAEDDTDVLQKDTAELLLPSGKGGWQRTELRLPYSRDFDPDVLLLDNYIPFHTLIFERRILEEVAGETGDPFDESLPFFEDWDLLIRLSGRTSFQHRRRVTCEYRHFRGGAHHVFGEAPRHHRDFFEVKARVLAKYASELEPAGLARAVDTLRREAVRAGEAASSRAAELVRQRRRAARVEDRYHRLNGELQSLRGDYRDLRRAGAAKDAEIERMFAEERRLREEEGRLHDEVLRLQETLGQRDGEIQQLYAGNQEQSEHLARTYAEIERLGGLIRDMEGTRLWRLHAWMAARRGSHGGSGSGGAGGGETSAS